MHVIVFFNTTALKPTLLFGKKKQSFFNMFVHTYVNAACIYSVLHVYSGMKFTENFTQYMLIL